MNQADIESKDLGAHVVACGERYKTLFNGLRRVERILIGVAGLIIVGSLSITGTLLSVLYNLSMGPLP